MKENINTQNPTPLPNEPVMQEEVPEEKSKKWLIIVLAVLGVALVAFGVYYITKTFLIDEPEDDGVQIPLEISEQIVIDLEDGRELVLDKVPTVTDSSEYDLIRDDNIKVWEDNDDAAGSIVYYWTYYKSRGDYINVDNPERVTVDGVIYEYISKTDGDDSTGSGQGLVWNTDSTGDVNGYPAYELISYYNPPIDANTSSSGDFEGVDNSSGVNIGYMFDLEDIFDDVEGLLVFGEVSTNEGMNASEYFTADFSMEVR